MKPRSGLRRRISDQLQVGADDRPGRLGNSLYRVTASIRRQGNARRPPASWRHRRTRAPPYTSRWRRVTPALGARARSAARCGTSWSSPARWERRVRRSSRCRGWSARSRSGRLPRRQCQPRRRSRGTASRCEISPALSSEPRSAATRRVLVLARLDLRSRIGHCHRPTSIGPMEVELPDGNRRDASRRRHRRGRGRGDRRRAGARGARGQGRRRAPRPLAPAAREPPERAGEARDPHRPQRRGGAEPDPPRRRARAGGGGDGVVSGREDLDRAADRERLLLRLRLPRGSVAVRGRLRADRGQDARAHRGRRAVRARGRARRARRSTASCARPRTTRSS